MTERVKPRRYNSPRRQQQAAATRREILDAARRLFERQGYAPTTMAAIAAEAGVALRTVYVAFETKSGVLRALWHLTLRGDEDETPMGGRPWFREVLDEPDPARQMRLVARNGRLVKLRIAGLMEVIHGAAPVDPDIDVLWRRIRTDFHALLRTIAEGLDARGALRAGLGVERAADVLWALNDPALWQALVRERAWTPDEYEDWLAGALCAELLSGGPAPGA